MAVHGRGLVCLVVTRMALERLGIQLITPDRAAGDGVAYGTSFEAREGVTTGISASDRARSIQVASDQSSGPADVVMPGHVPPIAVASGGVLERPSRYEAAFDLDRVVGEMLDLYRYAGA